MAENRQQLEELALLLEETEKRIRYNKLSYSFPDTGKFSRDKYTKHVKFMNAGGKYMERAFVAGNRTGKTFAASYEMALHATGLYPDWWEGKRFTRPVRCWAVGKTNVAAMGIVQLALLGPREDEGSGMIPKHLLAREPTSKPGIPGARQDIFVNHISGGISTIQIMSQEAGVDAFMGTSIDVIWLDEECPTDIYSECLIRTMTTRGSIIATFTPKKGVTDTFLRFVPEMRIDPEGMEVDKHKFVIGATWADNPPHLDDDIKQIVEASLLPWERQAAMEGIPSIGEGKIFPVAEPDILVEPFKIPDHYQHFAGLDVGNECTACVFIARDPKTDVCYIYDEYYRGYAEPALHALAIKARGAWIPIAIDPASNASNVKDGSKLFQEYAKEGLILMNADNAVHAGLLDVFQKLSFGKLKVFKTCQNWVKEFRLYRYDKHGQVAAKQADHAMDATRYAMRTSINYAKIKINLDEEEDLRYNSSSVPKDDTTGY